MEERADEERKKIQDQCRTEIDQYLDKHCEDMAECRQEFDSQLALAQEEKVKLEKAR